MSHVFKHPKYYKELRASLKKEAISPDGSTDPDGRAPSDKQQASSGTGPGAKLQASSNKPQATSHKLPGPRPISNANKGLIHRRQASSTKLVQVPDASVKPRAKSIKLQAASNKLPDSFSLIKFYRDRSQGLY